LTLVHISKAEPPELTMTSTTSLFIHKIGTPYGAALGLGFTMNTALFWGNVALNVAGPMRFLRAHHRRHQMGLNALSSIKIFAEFYRWAKVCCHSRARSTFPTWPFISITFSRVPLPRPLGMQGQPTSRATLKGRPLCVHSCGLPPPFALLLRPGQA